MGHDGTGVTAKLTLSRAIPLDLPRRAGSDVAMAPLSVEIRADGAAVIDGFSTPSDAEILARARAARARDPEVRAVIRADARVDHGRVIRVLDLLQQAEVRRIAFGR